MLVKIKGCEFQIEIRPRNLSYTAVALDCPGCPEIPACLTETSAIAQIIEALKVFIDAEHRTPHQLRVDKMMRLICDLHGREIPGNTVLRSKVNNLSFEGRKLRAALILEETLELIKALGIMVSINDGTIIVSDDEELKLEFQDAGPADLVGVVDGCCDLKVVTTGTLSAFGIADEEIQEIVDLNNLAKFAEGAYIREDGKLVKPANHVKPDIDGWLGTQP